MEATVGTALMRDDIATQVVKFAVPTKKGRRSQSGPIRGCRARIA